MFSHGIDPVPERKRQTTWHTFLKAHWDVPASVDFTTIEAWTRNGLVTYYLLFFMDLATRRVHFAGLTTNPDEAWLLQIARNLTDAGEGFLRGKRYILMDRDTKYSEVSRNTLEDGGATPVRLPPRSPNLNSHIERFLRSLKEECLPLIIVKQNAFLAELFSEHAILGPKVLDYFLLSMIDPASEDQE